MHQAVALASLAQAVLTVLPLPGIRFSRVRPIVYPKPFSVYYRNQIAKTYFSSGLYLYQYVNDLSCSFEHYKDTTIITDSQHFSYVFYHFLLNVVSTREHTLKTAELCYNKLKRTNNHSFLFGILVYFFLTIMGVLTLF